MRILAYHLPQFHEIAENNEWWGEGFTEWTNLNKENKFGGGFQPLLGQYNLLEKKTMEMQTELAATYGVYGFCYYHYYFKGKKLLEKPVENLLEWKDINQKFCFCWANHDWIRSKDGVKEVLIKQEYGEEKDWAEHFDYLKQFFLDERYIKIDNKPLFAIFNILFDEKGKIIDYFNERCKELGFDGIFYAQSIFSLKYQKDASDNTDAYIIREPAFSQKASLTTRVINKFRRDILGVPSIFSARTIIKKSLKDLKTLSLDKPYFLGAFSMWNNTYRHGAKGYIIKRPSRRIFTAYIKALKEFAEQRGIEYCFFNAWNEWAEGMILEPDSQNGYMFLDGIKKVLLVDI